MNVLLPTLRRPTIASLSSGSAAERRALGRFDLGRRRQMLDDRRQKLFAVAVGLHAGHDQRPLAQPAELVDLGVGAGRIAFVDDEQLRLVDPPQALGHLQVEGHRAA